MDYPTDLSPIAPSTVSVQDDRAIFEPLAGDLDPILLAHGSWAWGSLVRGQRTQSEQDQRGRLPARHHAQPLLPLHGFVGVVSILCRDQALVEDGLIGFYLRPLRALAVPEHHAGLLCIYEALPCSG